MTTPAGDALPFRESDGGLFVDARAVERHPFGTRYCLRLGADRGSIRLRADRPAPGALARLLEGAVAGAIIEVPAGRYDAESFPLTVPAGVTVRGAGVGARHDRRGGSSAWSSTAATAPRSKA